MKDTEMLQQVPNMHPNQALPASPQGIDVQPLLPCLSLLSCLCLCDATEAHLWVTGCTNQRVAVTQRVLHMQGMLVHAPA